jgi:hypothetical protein
MPPTPSLPAEPASGKWRRGIESRPARELLSLRGKDNESRAELASKINLTPKLQVFSGSGLAGFEPTMQAKEAPLMLSVVARSVIFGGILNL